MLSRCLFVGMVLMLILEGLTAGATLYVGSDPNLFIYQSIQGAIDASLNGDTIIVKPGTYTGDGNRDIDFSGKAIILRSEDPNDPNIVNTTIIDCESTSLERHSGFIFESGEDNLSILSGLTITHGRGLSAIIEWYGVQYAMYLGSAIYCNGSNPTIINCVLKENIDEDEWSDGTICCVNGASPHIEKCIISDNSCEWAGGISCWINSCPEIINCQIKNNIATVGGISCYTNSNPIVFGCDISDNSIFLSGSHSSGTGGIYCYDACSPIIEKCVFRNNYADYGGALYYEENSHPVMKNCLISNNYVTRAGGAVNGYYGNAQFINCTIVNNTAEWYGGGGLEFGLGGSPVVTNCIIYGNIASIGAQVHHVAMYATYSYCNIQNSGGSANWNVSGGIDGGGNIDANPEFVDFDGGNYHLASNSLCIDAGDPNGNYDGQVDIDNEDRVISGTADIGADECNNYRYYEFNEIDGEAAYDSNPNNPCNAILVNGPIWKPSDGAIGGALRFDGTNDYVKVVDPNYYGIAGTHARTVSMWFKTSSPAWQSGGSMPYTLPLVQWGCCATGQLWQVRLDPDRSACVGIYGGSVHSSKPLNDGLWHHIVAVLQEGESDSTHIQLYVDGVLDTVPTANSCTSCIDTNAASVPVHIGAFYNSSSQSVTAYFQGLIDDVRIDPTAWDAEDVKVYYRRNIKVLDDADIYFNCNEGAGITLHDLGGEDIQHGTLCRTEAWIYRDSTCGWDLRMYGTHYSVISTYNGIAGTHARTVSVWFRTGDRAWEPPVGRSYTLNYMPMVQWGHDTSGELWMVGLTPDRKPFVSVFSGGVTGSTALNDKQWHNLVAVLEEGETDPNNIKLYVDGQLDAIPMNETGAVVNTDTTDMPVYIGTWCRYNNGNPCFPLQSGADSNYMRGEVDDIRIYPKAWDSNEVEVYYQNTLTARENDLRDEAIVYFNCDEGAGTTLNNRNDYGEDRYDAVLYNGVSWSTYGVFDGAITFDGIDDYGLIPSYYGVGGTSDRAVSLWVKTTASGTLIQWGSDTAKGYGKLWLVSVVANGLVQVDAGGGGGPQFFCS